MSGHTVAFKAHGIDTKVNASACGSESASQRGTVLHITCGLSTLCMWLSADDMRAIAHALTLAADESQMQPAEVEA